MRLDYGTSDLKVIFVEQQVVLPFFYSELSGFVKKIILFS
jgi:hypothetical protein